MVARKSISAAVPEWRRPVISVPLTQAFPELDAVKEFRSRVCLFNHDRSQLLNVVSPKYQVIEHGNAVDTMQRALVEAFGSDAAKIEPSVRSIAEGRRIRAEWKLPFVKPVEVKKGDLVEITMVMYNSYDSTWRFSAQLGAFRLVCSNGMTVGHSFGSINGKHYPSTGQSDVLTESVERLVARAPRLQDVWQEWDTDKVAFDDPVVEAIADTFPKKYTTAILQEEGFPKTKWQLYNDLTYFATHETKSVQRRIEFDEAIASLFYRGALPEEQAA